MQILKFQCHKWHNEKNSIGDKIYYRSLHILLSFETELIKRNLYNYLGNTGLAVPYQGY